MEDRWKERKASIGKIEMVDIVRRYACRTKQVQFHSFVQLVRSSKMSSLKRRDRATKKTTAE